MARWVAAWLVGAALVLGVARFTIVPRTDSWTIVASLPDESVFLTRYTVSNTGLFADQLTTRLTLLRPDGAPIAHRSIAGPARLDDAGIHDAGDGLDVSPAGTTWRVAGDSLTARGHVDTAAAACPPAPGPLTGFVHIPDDVGDNGEAIPVRGIGIVVRTSTAGNANGSALYAFDQTGVIGLDPLGRCPSFLTLDGVTSTGPPPWIPPVPDEAFTLDFGGHILGIHLGNREIEESPLTTTLLPERWLAAAVGYTLPTSRLVRARVSIDHRPPWTAVLVLGAH